MQPVGLVLKAVALSAMLSASVIAEDIGVGTIAPPRDDASSLSPVTEPPVSASPSTPDVTPLNTLPHTPTPDTTVVNTLPPTPTPNVTQFNTIPPSPTPSFIDTTPPSPSPSPPPSSTCSQIANKDRAGFDLGNVKGPISSCEDQCKKTKYCVTWTWNDYQGGTCWLKSHSGKLIDKAGVTATDCIFDVPKLVCGAYTDIDFVGMDIANKPSASADGCCDICTEYSGCTAYAWNSYNGGTCWLKKSVGHVIYQPGVISSSTVQLWGPVCPFEYDTDFEGNDIANKPGADAGKCCDLCKSHNGCAAYTWSNYQGGTCWLKGAKGKAIQAKGKISAKLVGF